MLPDTHLSYASLSCFSRLLFQDFGAQNFGFLSLIVSYIRKFDASLLITAFKDIILLAQENPFLSQALFIVISIASVDASSSVDEQMAQSTLLGIKANQILILDLDPSKYEAFLQPLIECLNTLLWLLLYQWWRTFLWLFYLKLTQLHAMKRALQLPLSSWIIDKLPSPSLASVA